MMPSGSLTPPRPRGARPAPPAPSLAHGVPARDVGGSGDRGRTASFRGAPRRPDTGARRGVGRPSRRARGLWLVGALALLAGTSGAARATDYLVEIVLFETLGEDDGASGGDLWFPKVGSALGLASERAAEAGFRLIETETTLDESARAIAGSSRYRLLRHFAWRQPGLDAKAARAIRVNLGEVFDLHIPDDVAPYEEFVPARAAPEPGFERAVRSTTVNGSLKVRLGRFLHLESLLVFTDRESGRSYRLSESRKMRSTELHYIDNPRFGLLVRILPIDDTGGS